MPDIKEDCRLLISDMTAVVSDVRKANAKRGALARKALPLFDKSLAHAGEKVEDSKDALNTVEELAHQQRFYVPGIIRREIRSEKQKLEMYRTINSKLSKARQLCEKITLEDRNRADSILRLQSQAADLLRLIPASATEAQWKQMNEKLESIKKQINELYDQILASEVRIQHYYQLVQSYDEAYPERFAAHWLEAATVILERQDAYGFTGEILYRDLGTTKTPNTGLEAGSSLSYGAILKEDQVIQYTYPNTAIKIEHDSTGKITDNTVYDDKITEKQANLAAIKFAKLLLMDCQLRKDPTMYIKGPAELMPQAIRVYAALEVLARQAGIELEDEKFKSLVNVQVPGWNAAKAQIAAAKPDIEKMINTTGQDEFLGIKRQLSATKDVAEDETVFKKAPRSSGGFGVSS